MKQMILIIALVFASVVFIACSEDDTKEAVSDVVLCTQVADKVESCTGWDTFGLSYASVMAECLKATFDDYDQCLFECLEHKDCETFGDCMDGC